MSFFHLKRMPGRSWPPLATPQFSLLWSAYQELDRTQWLSAEEIEQGQVSQFRDLIRHCIDHVPYYRRLFADAGITPDGIKDMADVRRVPVTPRRACLEHASEFQAEKLPPGTVAGNAVRTSGGTGVPIRVCQTNVDQLWWHACHLRDLEWSRVDPRGTLAAIRYFRVSGPEGERARRGVSLNCWNEALSQLIENGPAYAMDIHQKPRLQLEWLRRVDPDYLLSFPSNLEFLARLVADSGQKLPRLRTIQAISETLTEENQALIESAFGVPVRNNYSCQEAGYLASPCPEEGALHVYSESALLEVLDPDGNPCPPGVPGHVVITALHNFLTPFVRYELGDTVTLGNTPCPCGRGLPVLSQIVGKTHPLLLLPNGERINSSRLVVLIRMVGGFYQFRIIQRAVDRYEVLIVPAPSWSPEHQQKIQDGIVEFLGSEVNVDVVSVERIEPLAGGKSVDITVEI